MTIFPVNAATLKKVKIQVENLHTVKLKDEKAAKSKKPAAKGRTTVKMDLEKVKIDSAQGSGSASRFCGATRKVLNLKIGFREVLTAHCRRRA